MGVEVDFSLLAKSLEGINKQKRDIAEAIIPTISIMEQQNNVIGAACKSIADVAKQNQINIKSMVECIPSITEPFYVINNAIKGFSKIMLEVSKQQNISINRLMKIASTNYNFSSQLKNITESQNSLMSNIAQAIISNNTISLDSFSESINENEVEELIGDRTSFEENINKVIINERLNWQQKLVAIITEFFKKNPVMAFVVMLLVLNPIKANMEDILQSSYGNAIQAIGIHEVSKENQKEFKKEVVNNIIIMNSEYKESILNSYRFVSKEGLEIRASNKIKSNILYKLSYGDVVEILYKHKNWTLIQYQEKQGELIKGWVLTRYISRFD